MNIIQVLKFICFELIFNLTIIKTTKCKLMNHNKINNIFQIENGVKSVLCHRCGKFTSE